MGMRLDFGGAGKIWNQAAMQPWVSLPPTEEQTVLAPAGNAVFAPGIGT